MLVEDSTPLAPSLPSRSSWRSTCRSGCGCHVAVESSRENGILAGSSHRVPRGSPSVRGAADRPRGGGPLPRCTVAPPTKLRGAPRSSLDAGRLDNLLRWALPRGAASDVTPFGLAGVRLPDGFSIRPATPARRRCSEPFAPATARDARCDAGCRVERSRSRASSDRDSDGNRALPAFYIDVLVRAVDLPPRGGLRTLWFARSSIRL